MKSSNTVTLSPPTCMATREAQTTTAAARTEILSPSEKERIKQLCNKHVEHSSCEYKTEKRQLLSGLIQQEKKNAASKLFHRLENPEKLKVRSCQPVVMLHISCS